MEKIEEIRIGELEKLFTNKEQDLKAIFAQLSESKNAEEKNQLNRQIERLTKEMEEIEQNIKNLQTPQHPLFDILSPYSDKAINSAIQRAYQSCCYGNLPQDIPNTVDAILKDLNDIDKGKRKFNDNDSIAKFIKYLIADANIPTELSQKLKTWGIKNIEGFKELERSNINSPLESYILIKIEPLKTKSKIKRFTIRAWVIPNIQNYNLHTHQGYEKIDVSDSPDDSFKFDSIPNLLTIILNNCAKYTLGKFPILVFFLPTNMLVYPLEQWIIEEDGIEYNVGKKYRVIVRDYDRLSKQYRNRKKQIWDEKWGQINQFKCIDKFKYQEDEDLDSLLEILDDAIGIIITTLSEQDHNNKIFRIFLNSATPIGIYHRQKNQSNDLSDCLNCCITELPEIVRKKRLQARKNEQNHLGHHISLIWEDPHLLTPESDLIIITN